jgi:hypothetical protein
MLNIYNPWGFSQDVALSDLQTDFDAVGFVV